MKKALAFATLALTTLVLVTTAAAKGPSEATVEGAGLDAPLSFRGMGEPGSRSRLARLAEASGFFPALFRRTPDPMLAKRPTAELGPRYTITYRLPGLGGSESVVRQDAYPYAAGGPVTYTRPGQRFFDGQRTRGGWFVASSDLETVLVEAGLPPTPPSPASDGWSPLDPSPLTVALAAAALAVAGASAAVVRRRLRPAPARP